jgi:hypothetical protein
MNFEQSQTWRELANDTGNYYCSATDAERAIMRDWVRDLLKEREVTVDFEKATGEFRSMKCTLNQDLGAKYTVKENTTPKKPNPDVCVVWDVNQAAWRSFRWDRVKRIQFDLG